MSKVDAHVSIRLSGKVLSAIRDDMHSIGYGARRRSQWICEAINDLVNQIKKENAEDALLSFKLYTPVSEAAAPIKVILTENAIESLDKIKHFCELGGIDIKNIQSRSIHMAITMRLQKASTKP